MTRAQTASSRYALGAALIASLVLGGGTASGLAIDAALQVFVIICATYVYVLHRERPTSKAAVAFFLLVLFAGLVQLIPMPVSLLKLGRPEIFLPYLPGSQAPIDTATISLAASRTVLSTIFALVPIYFFIAANKMQSSDLSGLIPFYMIGVLCNLVAAAVQYSLAADATLNDLLGYEVMVGMFANVNHFSTLLVSAIPMILYLGIFMGRRALALTALLMVVVVLLAAKSLAGIGLGIAITIVAVASLGWRGRVGGAALVALMAIVVAYGYGAVVQFGDQNLDSEYGRRYFALTTLEGIKDNWLFGVGYGAFDNVFPYYETREAISALYVNHAHNDFLEVIFEGGVLGALILVIYLAAFFWRAFQANQALQRLAALSIAMILIHSTVDYPLRTMAVAMSFAFFNALLFSQSRRQEAMPGQATFKSRSPSPA